MTNIRQSILEKRKNMSFEQVKLASEEIGNKLYKELEKSWKDVDTFLCYYPLGNEVDITQIFHMLLKKKKLYFPVTKGDAMEFYSVRSLEELKEGRFHIMEPEPITQNKLVPDNKPWVCFTPGVVFDKNNNRMGFGRGFYDRYFAEMSKLCQPIAKIGLAYDFQIVDEIPANPWDVPMDFVIKSDPFDTPKA